MMSNKPIKPENNHSFIMSTDDKPFGCPEAGCNMCFSNVDHLNVHRQKHKMSLSLGSGSAKGFLFMGDQTPTPTKCLRNLDQEITLFGELSKPSFEVNKNPFEEAFRKAAQEVGSLSMPNHIQEESLNTPTPVVHSSHDSAIIPLPGPSGTGLHPGDSLNTPIPTVAKVTDVPSSSSQQTVVEIVENIIPKRTATTPVISESSGGLREIQQLETSPIDLSVNRDDSSGETEPTSPKTIPQAASKQEEGILSNSATLALITSTSLSQMNSPVSTGAVESHKFLPQAPAAEPQCVAVLVKLPNGSTVPVHLPAQLGAMSVKPAATKTVVTQPVTVSSSSVTKQKLKEALIGQNIRVMSEAVDRVTNPVQTESFLDGSTVLISRPISKGPDVQTRAADTSTPNRKRKLEEDDPDERRKKFLERNRAAAARCRQKKKVWINGLEQKADDLQGTNNALLNEVTLLKSEVAQLKQLLLAHKDCPITLQQQNAGQVAFQEVQTLEVTPQGMKMVANTVLVTPHSHASNEASGSHIITTKMKE